MGGGIAAAGATLLCGPAQPGVIDTSVQTRGGIMGGTGIDRNWAGNLAYRASAVVHPGSIDEVSAALATGGPVRVLGTRHCFNDIADTVGTHIALDRMPAVIEVSEQRAAGCGALRYGDIAPALEAQGLALANLASLPHISTPITPTPPAEGPSVDSQ